MSLARSAAAPRAVGILTFPGFQLLDVTGPVTVFETASHLAGAGKGYPVRLLSLAGGMVASSAGVALATEPAGAQAFDTLMVPGGAGTRSRDLDPRIGEYLRDASGCSRRVASVCTGAFLLAAAGLLDGRRVTTHWRHGAALARRFPALDVVADRIWVNDGRFWTSAGVSAGIDLALALVAEDLGAEVARACAREIVVYYRRPGGQSQFSSIDDLTDPGGRFAPLLQWIRRNVHRPLRVEDLAERVAMSPRNFARRFRAEVGHTPARAVSQIRLEVARRLVESSGRSIESVARDTGFGDAETMRRAFVKSLGRPPRSLRTEARSADQSRDAGLDASTAQR